MNFTTEATPVVGAKTNKIGYLKTELDTAYYLIPLGIKAVHTLEGGEEVLEFTDKSPYLKPTSMQFTEQDKLEYKKNIAAPFVRYSVHGTNIDNKTKDGKYMPGFSFPCFNKTLNPDLEMGYDGDGCPVCSLFYGLKMLASEAQKDLITNLIAKSGINPSEVLDGNGRVLKTSSFYKDIYKVASRNTYGRYDILNSGSYTDESGEKKDSATKTTHIMLFARLKLEGNLRLKGSDDPNNPLPLDWDVIATDLTQSRLSKMGDALYKAYGDESREIKANIPFRFYFPKKEDKKAAGKDLSIGLWDRVVYGPLYSQNPGVFETEADYGAKFLTPLITAINAMQITTTDIKNMFTQIKPKPLTEVQAKLLPTVTRVVGETVNIARLQQDVERFKKIDERVGQFIDWDKALQLSQTGSVQTSTVGVGQVGNEQVANQGGFGQAPVANQGGFGQAPVTNQGGFGQAPAPVADPTPVANQGGFGQAPVADPTPVANQGGFGQAPVTNQGGFGQAPVADSIPVTNQGGFGQAPVANQGGFGQAPTTNPAPVANQGGFGQAPATNPAPATNQGGFGQAPQNTGWGR